MSCGARRLVEADGGVYLLHDLGGRHREAAAPHLVGGLVGHEDCLPVVAGCASRERRCQPRIRSRRAAENSARHGAVARRPLPRSPGFAAVYVTLGRPDNAVRPAGQTPPVSREPRQPAAPSGPGSQRPEPGADGGLRVPQGAGGPARGQLPGRHRQGAHARPTGAARSCSSTCGRPGACPAARRCRRSTGCRRRWAPTKFEVVALSVDRTGLAGARKFLDETKVENLALYADPTARLSSTLRAVGLPATAAARHARAARSAACSAPPNGTARTPSA